MPMEMMRGPHGCKREIESRPHETIAVRQTFGRGLGQRSAGGPQEQHHHRRSTRTAGNRPPTDNSRAEHQARGHGLSQRRRTFEREATAKSSRARAAG